MRCHFLLGLAGLVLVPGPGLTTDLTKIERKIAKEPKYECAKPLYGLLVFGPKPKPRRGSFSISPRRIPLPTMCSISIAPARAI